MEDWSAEAACLAGCFAAEADQVLGYFLSLPKMASTPNRIV